MPLPKKNLAYTFDIVLVDSANRPQFKSNPTIAAGDFKVSKDEGTLTNLATLPVVAPASSVMVKVALSDTEMNADRVAIVGKDAAGGEWDDVFVYIDTVAAGGSGVVPTFEGGEVVLTGETPVTVVAAPASGEQRRAESLMLRNRDSATRTITLQKKKGATTHDVKSWEVASGQPQELLENPMVLDATDETLQVVSDATAATTEPLVHVSVFKVSQ